MISTAKPIIGKEECVNVLKVLWSGQIAQGKKVEALEKAFASYCGVRYGVAVNSGTAALHTALHTLDIGEGDEVITSPFTFVATANAIHMQGAKVVFADIDPNTFTIDPKEVEKRITPKTKAIIAVNLFGYPAAYKALQERAGKSIKIIEDACQSHGAQYEGRKSGALGDVACFSFYATKNMTTGEGGMITTDDRNVFEKAKRFRHHGQTATYTYDALGYNYRMTDIQAAMGLAQLKKLDAFTKRRRENARMLREALGEVQLVLPDEITTGKQVYHQFTVRCKERDALQEWLLKKGIQAGVFYPKPLHLTHELLKGTYKEGDFPEAEKASREVISLPVHPGLSKKEMKQIIRAVQEFFGQ